MKRTALLIALLLAVVACSPADTTTTTAPSLESATSTIAGTTTSAPAVATTTADGGFPVTVAADNGSVTIDSRPTAVISISASATEMLFAMGAGDQVVAVDDQSDYPAEAPMTDLSGFTPNLEAILAFQPDLVIASFDPGSLVEGLEVAGVPVLLLNAAPTIDDVYRQIEVIGVATGNIDQALLVNGEIREGLEAVVAEAATAADGVTYYHELDNTLYSVTSQSFIGQLYALLGMVNIADPADPDGASFGFPQLSSEYVVTADPDIIFLADAVFGESAETLAARPGWEGMSALISGAVVELDDDVSSRWGPRIVEFLQVIADSVMSLQPSS